MRLRKKIKGKKLAKGGRTAHTALELPSGRDVGVDVVGGSAVGRECNTTSGSNWLARRVRLVVSACTA
jgi:hypothetical protein